MSLTRTKALELVEATFAQAAARGLTKVSVVVTDPGGHVRVAMRGDGQGIFGVETATAKAVSALGFGRSTLAQTASFSPQAVAAIAGATHGRFAPLGGGVVVVDDHETVVAGAAISGGMPEVDHEIIVAAVEQVGLKALP